MQTPAKPLKYLLKTSTETKVNTTNNYTVLINKNVMYKNKSLCTLLTILRAQKQIHAAFIALVWGINQTKVSNAICKSWGEEKKKFIYIYIPPLKAHTYI